MTRHALPILVPGRTSPVHVPFELQDSFIFSAFLPSRGVRTFTAWLTTRDPLKADVGDVLLNRAEGDPRGPNGLELDEDEQRRADEAAGDVLRYVLATLGIHPSLRGAVGLDALHGSILHAIATTYVAEEALYGETVRLSQALHRLMPKTTAEQDVLRLAVLDDDKTPENSPSVYALAAYAEHAVEVTTIAKKATAEIQRNAHVSGDEDDAGSERIRAPRHLDAPTLKCLDVEF